MKACVAYIDGGSRGNPGVAGYGVDIRDEHGQPLASLSKSLGNRTNNFAEYSALIGALEYANSHGYDAVRIYADSELLVRQVNGLYRVKSLDLKPLYDRAMALISKLKQFSIHHIPRDQNREADRLANLAMDGASTSAASISNPLQARQVLAVYRNGCFHPLDSLDLPENTSFRLMITPIGD
jgi:ribonuclease HI